MIDTAPSSDARRLLLEKIRRRQPALESIPKAESTTVPVSSGQEQLWLHAQSAHNAPIYNDCVTIRRAGPLQPALVEQCFRALIARHEILRSHFSLVDGDVLQSVQPEAPFTLAFTDLSAAAPAVRQQQAQLLANADVSQIFDLERGPLFRVRLLRLAEDDHRISLSMHHLIFDGVSIYQILVPEFITLYQSLEAGQPSPLPELRLQYRDFAVWQRAQLAQGVALHQIDFWRKTLAGEMPRLELPGARTRGDLSSTRGGIETCTLNPALSEAVRRLSREQGVTVYVTLLAAFKTLLHRYAGQEDVVVGGTTSTRRRSDLEPIAGYFLNTMVLRTAVAPNASFAEMLGRVQDTVLDALANSDIPFDQVVRALAPKRDAYSQTFFQALFSSRPPATGFPAGWEISEDEGHSGAAKFDLFLETTEHSETISARLLFREQSCSPAAAKRLLGHWLQILETVTAQPGTLIRDIPLLTAAERAHLLAAGSGCQRAIPGVTINALIEQQAALTPHSTAVMAGGERLTYRDLTARVDSFAARLTRAGVAPGHLVAVSVERSAEMLIALLGVLKAGAAYLPIDPSLPPGRAQLLREDARPAASISGRSLQLTPLAQNANPVSPELAYVLYTSGSTGRPKGVAIPQRSVINFLLSMRDQPGFTPADTLLAVTTCSFDISVLELFLPLISGGVVAIAAQDTAKDPNALACALRDSRATVLQGTPTMFRLLLEAGWRGDPKLKVLCGGEPASPALMDQLASTCAEVWNMYGPTETTVWSTVHSIHPSAARVSIGRPIHNTRAYVLDAHRNLLPEGLPGELFLGGDGLAHGYLGAPDLTAQRFVPNPFFPAERMYATGDRARWLPNGTLECLGRTDLQVKIRGFRIEPEEIEAVLAAHPEVTAAAVKPCNGASGEPTLIAFIQGTASASSLRAFLASKLPDYMVPARFLHLRRLPLNASGKVDRKALPEPAPCEKSPEDPSDLATDVERRLASIWQSVLGIANIKRGDNFFELGGHSLQAAKLLRKIEAEFQKPVTLATFFHAPTLAKMAAALESPGAAAPTPNAVPIQPRTGRKTLYWMDAGPHLRPLAANLLPTYSLMGMFLRRDQVAALSHSPALSEIASVIVAAILEDDPRGPYNVGGYCADGVLAYEVAAQLEALQKEVSLLVLLHAPNPRSYRALSKTAMRASKLRYHAGRILRMNSAEARTYANNRLRNFARRAKPVPADDNFLHLLTVAATAYNPQPIRARIALFQPQSRPGLFDYVEGWTGLPAAGLEHYDVPGDHETILAEPNVQTLAAQMLTCLERRQPGNL